MATTVWKGYITFGLVSIPVRLFRAARPERVKLHQLYRPAQMRESEPAPERPNIAAPQKRSNAAVLHVAPEPEPEPVARVRRVYEGTAGEAQQPIAPSALLKGYEYEKGQYVVLDPDDLRQLAPQTSTQMEIGQFVHFSDIDPIYLDASYYVTPDESGEKAYALLFEAMRKTRYAAIGEVTMHRRDHVMIVRPGKSGLIAHTIFYADEVRTLDEFRTDVSSVQPKELSLAETLIQALAKPFNPEQFKSAYRERMRQLIESKAALRQPAKIEQPARAPVIDIMTALQQSLQSARAKPAAEEATQRKPASGERAAAKRNHRSRSAKRR